MLSGRGLCGELITRPEESYRMCCVIVCDLETSRMRPWPSGGLSRQKRETKSPSERSLFHSIFLCNFSLSYCSSCPCFLSIVLIFFTTSFSSLLPISLSIVCLLSFPNSLLCFLSPFTAHLFRFYFIINQQTSITVGPPHMRPRDLQQAPVGTARHKDRQSHTLPTQRHGSP